jgi:hypothetical protein
VSLLWDVIRVAVGAVDVLMNLPESPEESLVFVMLEARILGCGDVGFG